MLILCSRRLRRTLLPSVLALPASLLGQEVKTRSFTGDIGFVSTAGNTSVSTLNLGDRFMLQTADRKLIFTQALGIVYGRTEGEKSAENYRGQLRFDYGLDGAMYLFALAGWDRNVFGGITRRFEETAGVAWKPVRLPQNELTVEVGLSLFQQRNTVDANGGLEDNFIAGRAAALYRQSLTSTAFLTQSVEFIPNFDRSTDWRLNTESAVVAPISTAIGVKLSYVIRYDNLPGLKPDPNPNQERLEKTDRFFSAGLTIAY